MSLFDDLFGNFTGGQSRDDLAQANQTSKAAYNQGYQGATGAVNQGYGDFDKSYGTAQGYYSPYKGMTGGDTYESAQGYLDPYVQSGGQYQSNYDDLMGLNGPEARARAQGVITSDPLWSGALGQDQNAMLRNLNARGMSGSGTAALAGQRVLLDNYTPWLDRYRQGGEMGMAAAGQASQNAMNRSGQEFNAGVNAADRMSSNAMMRGSAGIDRGNTLADYNWSQGQVKGANAINYGNAMSGTRSTGMNNLLNIAGTVANAIPG